MELTLDNAVFGGYTINRSRIQRSLMSRAAKVKPEMAETFGEPFSLHLKSTAPVSGVNVTAPTVEENTQNVHQEPTVATDTKPAQSFEISTNIILMDSKRAKDEDKVKKVAVATPAFLANFANLFKGRKTTEKEEPTMQSEVFNPVNTIEKAPTEVAPAIEPIVTAVPIQEEKQAELEPVGFTPIAPEFSEKLPDKAMPAEESLPIVEQITPPVPEVKEEQPIVNQTLEAPKMEFTPETPVDTTTIIPEKTASKPLEAVSSVSIDTPETENIALTADTVLSHVSNMANELEDLRNKVRTYETQIKTLKTTIDSQNTKINAISFDLRKAEVENGKLINANKRQELRLADSEAQLSSVRVDAQRQIDEANAIAEKRIADAEIRGTEKYNKLVRGLAGVISPKTAPIESNESSMRMAA